MANELNLPEVDITEGLIDELKDSLENGDEISDKLFKKMSLLIAFDTHTEVRVINGRLKKVEKAVDRMEKQPSILTLLHLKPKLTITTIIGLLFLWSIVCHVMWDNNLIPAFLAWLGLPPFIP